MRRKAIAAVAVLLAAASLAACGDGGEETTAPSPGAGQGASSQSLEEVQERADQIKQERRDRESNGRPPTGKDKGNGTSSPSAPAPESPPDAAPPAQHSDSGGGAAQFQRKGADNSIPEYGQEGGAAELASAAAVLHGFLDARAAGRWELACSHLAAQVVASLEQFGAASGAEAAMGGCPNLLRTLSSGAGEAGLRAAAQADVGSLRVEGERGFLLYHGVKGVDFAMPVVLESGEWKLAAPDATPLP